MTKEDKQIIDRAVKEEWRIGDRSRLKRLLEKNLKLYRENVELEKENEEMKKGLGCETCQIHLEYMGLNDKINKLEKEYKLLGERCNQLLKDKGDLTDELAKWKEEWQEQVQKAIDEGWERTKLTGRVRELEQQIEKMKCCPNCDFVFRNGNCYYDKECKNKDHWKLRR